MCKICKQGSWEHNNKEHARICKKCGHEEPWKPGPAIEHGVKYEDVAVMIYELRNNVEVSIFQHNYRLYK